MAELYFLLPSHLRVSCKCAGGEGGSRESGLGDRDLGFYRC